MRDVGSTTQGAPRLDRHYISGTAGGGRAPPVEPQHRAAAGPVGLAALEGRNDARTGMPGRLLPGAMCVQRFDDSLNSAIHITYRISLRSSSMPEPRDPLLKVLTCFVLNQNVQYAFSNSEFGAAGGDGGGHGGPRWGAPTQPPPPRRGNARQEVRFTMGFEG